MLNFVKNVVSFFSGLMTSREKKDFEYFLSQSDKDKRSFEEFRAKTFSAEDFLLWKDIDVKQAYRCFENRTKKKRTVRMTAPFSAAAAVLVLAVGSLFLYLSRQQVVVPAEPSKDGIVFGSSKATLKLGTGETIDLSETEGALDGQFTTNGKGVLTYYEGKRADTLYNELIVPLGGEYRLALSDGTTVYLNSGTILRYPEAFSSRERRLELLEGEAFFAVSKDSLRPFYVTTQGMNIRVYGTEFNVNTYDTEHVYTTLVNGKVGISTETEREEVFLYPSMQADFDKKETKIIKVYEVDPIHYVSWKDGRYVFRNESLENMLKTLGVWYNFKVEFVNEELKNLHFSGNVKRYEDINRIIEAVSYSVGINITVKGNLLIVSN